MQTVAKRYFRASAQSSMISASQASGRSRVWSMRPARRHFPDAQFRSLQIGEDADRSAGIGLELADDGDALGVVVMTAVGKIQAKDVDAAFEQGLDHRRLGT